MFLSLFTASDNGNTMSSVSELVKIDEPVIKNLAKLCPTMPESKRSKLANASTWPWHSTRDFNQGDIFERKYREIAGYYYAQATGREALGVSILKLFAKYKPVVEAFVKEFTYSTEKVNGEFMGDLARGARETTIRPIVRDSFGDEAGTCYASYFQVPAAANAELHIIPDVASQAITTTVTAHENHRAWLILGYAELFATLPVIDGIQEWVNDSIGFRKPIYCYPQHAITNLLLVQSGTPLYVETGDQFDLDGFAISTNTTGIWPIGVEVIIDPSIGLNVGWPTAAEH